MFNINNLIKTVAAWLFVLCVHEIACGEKPQSDKRSDKKKIIGGNHLFVKEMNNINVKNCEQIARL